MSGKTTNLEIVHQKVPEENKGELTSISTDGDRTLFFDFMPLDLGTIAGMKVKFHLYTVPGQVYYNSTRKLVLLGADGIIFVADSTPGRMDDNQQSMDNLPDGSYEISPYGGNAGVYTESTAQPLLGSITGATSSFSFGVAARRCYTVDKHRTAHDVITRVVVWRFHHKVHWCATYPSIEETALTVDSFFSNVDPLFQVDWDDHATGWWYTWRGSQTGGHYSRRQGKIDNCVLKWGCIGTHYPQIEVWVNGNGAWAAK